MKKRSIEQIIKFWKKGAEVSTIIALIDNLTLDKDRVRVLTQVVRAIEKESYDKGYRRGYTNGRREITDAWRGGEEDGSD